MTLTTGARALDGTPDVVAGLDSQERVHDASWALPPQGTDPRVVAWVEEMAHLTTPDTVVWCDANSTRPRWQPQRDQSHDRGNPGNPVGAGHCPARLELLAVFLEGR